MRIRDALFRVNLTQSPLRAIDFNGSRLEFSVHMAEWDGVDEDDDFATPGTLTFYDVELVDADPALDSWLWGLAADSGVIMSMHHARTLNANMRDGVECIVEVETPEDGPQVLSLGFRATEVEWTSES